MSYRQYVQPFHIGDFLKWAAGQRRLDVHNVSQYIIARTPKGQLGDVLVFLNGYFGALAPEQLVNMPELPRIISSILSGYNKLHRQVANTHVGPSVYKNH